MSSERPRVPTTILRVPQIFENRPASVPGCAQRSSRPRRLTPLANATPQRTTPGDDQSFHADGRTKWHTVNLHGESPARSGLRERGPCDSMDQKQAQATSLETAECCGHEVAREVPHSEPAGRGGGSQGRGELSCALQTGSVKVFPRGFRPLKE